MNKKILLLAGFACFSLFSLALPKDEKVKDIKITKVKTKGMTLRIKGDVTAEQKRMIKDVLKDLHKKLKELNLQVVQVVEQPAVEEQVIEVVDADPQAVEVVETENAVVPILIAPASSARK